MTRIFVTMAGINLVALAVSFGLGVPYLLDRLGDQLGDPGNPLGDRPALITPVPYQPHAAVSIHFLVGLFTVIFTLLVHCLIFTYFLGTGRWVKEVARAYALPDDPWPRQTRELKRIAFPPALFSMLSAIAAAAAGAGAQLAVWPWWIHLALGAVTLLVNLWACRIEYQAVAHNARIIEQVMVEVARIRQRVVSREL